MAFGVRVERTGTGIAFGDGDPWLWPPAGTDARGLWGAAGCRQPQVHSGDRRVARTLAPAAQAVGDDQAHQRGTGNGPGSGVELPAIACG